ncbi:hypothetical protein R1sor_023384 [Riccia sorocarpa]|uniref:Uncharacterized protein n=1 Tax=Riccia sorocarpa TaxID=122646 RepID=A0ABD3GML8_9MARC
MSPPRNVFTNFPSPRLLQSPPNLGGQDQNTPDEDEDLGPIETEVLSEDDGYKSIEEVPVSAAARRFKETLREPKLPRVTQHGHTKSRSGDLDTDQTWEPPAGVRNFVNADGARLMLASQQLPLKSYAEIKRQTKSAQNIGTLETTQEGDVVRHVHAIRQDIQAHCYPFFDDAEKDWWNHWFIHQEIIGRNIGNSIRERLTGDMCWLWLVPPERDAEEEVELLAVTTAEDLRRRVFGIRRPIYSGPRKPPPGSAAADRAAHIGELTEIHDKSFLAVLAEDEVSFWICQVLKINGRNEGGEPTDVTIQWYATEDSNPYTGKFYPEKRRSNGKGRPVLFRQEVNLDAVTILSFNFIFTTTRRLLKITERQIRTVLFRIARVKQASEVDGNISPTADIGSADDEETDCSGPDSDPDEQ